MHWRDVAQTLDFDLDEWELWDIEANVKFMKRILTKYYKMGNN